VGDATQRSLMEEGVAADKITGEEDLLDWRELHPCENIGAFIGMLLFTKFAQKPRAQEGVRLRLCLPPCSPRSAISSSSMAVVTSG